MNIKFRILILQFFLLGMLMSCSTEEVKREDPLKNTKKLVLEGHKSLYYQGALPVKGTSIKFIPSYEDTELYLFDRRKEFATSEFSKAILRAKESIIVVKEGTKTSWKIAGTVDGAGNKTIQYLNEKATEPGLYIMYVSTAEGMGLVGSSFSAGIETHKKTVQNSETLRKEIDEWSNGLLAEKEVKDKSPNLRKRLDSYKKEYIDAFQSTVIGYVDLDQKLAEAKDESFEEFKSGGWSDRFATLEEARNSVSNSISQNLQETIYNVVPDTANELGEAKKDLFSIGDGEGISLALLKSLARTTKALFYDAVLKPIGKFTVLTVGYATWNGVIYPSAVIATATGTGLYCLVETIALAGKGVVYVTAPTIELGVSAILNSTEALAKESYLSMDKSAKVSAAFLRKATAYSVKGGALVTEASGKYILAPLTGVGAATSQSIYGGGLTLAGTTAGTGLTVASGAGQGVTYVTTKSSALAVGTVGTVASFGTGVGYGVYQLTKAVGIPSGVAVGSGIVLSYEFVAHMSAHTVLAVSDCAYLVLSMEGGKWVVYGVIDNSKKASRLLTGSVVDLEQVRKEGGKIVRVPVDEKEIQDILSKKKRKK